MTSMNHTGWRVVGCEDGVFRLELEDGAAIRLTSSEGATIEVRAAGPDDPHPGFLGVEIVDGGDNGSFPYWQLTESEDGREDQTALFSYGR